MGRVRAVIQGLEEDETAQGQLGMEVSLSQTILRESREEAFNQFSSQIYT